MRNKVGLISVSLLTLTSANSKEEDANAIHSVGGFYVLVDSS
jgi:hypothetical protein